MMWFQRHEEPKTITDDYEQVNFVDNKILLMDYFRVHTYFSTTNDGKHVNVTISYSNTSFWKIENFEFIHMLIEDRKRG